MFENENCKDKDCILFLTGTSTQVDDISYFIEYLISEGHSIVSIERFIGGLLDIRYNPKDERINSLEKTIRKLIDMYNIDKIHIIAHSYGSFEIVRLISSNPLKYADHIGNIILINPPGFIKKKHFVSHCMRFLFLFIMKEYCHILKNLLYKFNDNGDPDDLTTRKLQIINSIFINTMINPSRTIKEVADIVTFKIKPHIKNMIDYYGYRFYFVINLEDSLIESEKTLREIESFISAKYIATYSGNHFDLMINDDSMHNFASFLKDIMEKKC